jgi:transcriptional antiterminator RfaH
LLPVTDLEVGAEIKISSGPFAEFVGTVEAIDPDKRVWVLLELMGQKSKVRLESSQVSNV